MSPLRRFFAILFMIGAIGILIFCYSMDYFKFNRPAPTQALVSKRLEATTGPTKARGLDGMKYDKKITFVPSRELKPVRNPTRQIVDLIDENFKSHPQRSETVLNNDLFKPSRSKPKKRRKPRKNRVTERPKASGYNRSSVTDPTRLNSNSKRPMTNRERLRSRTPIRINGIVDTNSVLSAKLVSTTTSRPIVIVKNVYSKPRTSFGRPISSNPRKEVGVIHEERNNEIVKKLKPKPTPRPRSCDGCMEHEYQVMIMPPGCDPLRPPELLLLVISSPDKAEMRTAIRQTWGRSRGGKVKLVFLFGQPKDTAFNSILYDEHRQYHDILQEDFRDSYFNLTYKSMMAFKFVQDRCSNARYVMKTDDDMWINVDQFFRAVPSIDMKDTIGGMCILNAAPIRDTRSKWYASFDAYPESKYPGFCSGTAYFMTGKTARRIFEVSRDVPFLYLEDVYVSLCAEKAGISLKPVDGFHNYRVQPGMSWCGYKRGGLISSHGVSAEELLHLNHVDC